MTATNHVLTGAVFAAVVTANPWVALPVGFLLHFALDALPHYGNRGERPESGYKRLKVILPIDALVAALILVFIFVLRPDHWPVIILAGIACASPDLMWMAKFVRHLTGSSAVKQTNWLMRFHHWIQWGERPWGVYVEAVWFIVFGWILLVHVWK